MPGDQPSPQPSPRRVESSTFQGEGVPSPRRGEGQGEESFAVPREITRANEHDVKIIWPDGEVILPAFELRADCWCAMCVDESSGRKVLKRESLRADVHPNAIKPIGNYAIQIEFSDGHRTGLYTFKHLRELCERLAPKP